MILASQFTLELKENLQQKVHNESKKRSHAPRQEAQGAACSGNCLLPLIQAVVKGVKLFFTGKLVGLSKNFAFMFSKFLIEAKLSQAHVLS